MYTFILIVIFILIFIVVYYYQCNNNKYKNKYSEYFQTNSILNLILKDDFDKIPLEHDINNKNIFLTYKDKKIPQKVYDNLNKYTKGYTYHIYDDQECIIFLEKYFKKDIVDKFKDLQGAHKADLFRYCILYIYGGVYLDIKTILIKPIKDIFTDDNILYTVLGINNNCIHQGVISSPPRNNFFIKLIQFILSNPSPRNITDYGIYIRDFYDKICEEINKDIIQPGRNGNFYLFKEICDTQVNQGVCNKLDKYGYCCGIYDENELVIKTRWDDFPWKL